MDAHVGDSIVLESERVGQPAHSGVVEEVEPARGGHFAAFEQPELFVEEVRSFFRLVR